MKQALFANKDQFIQEYREAFLLAGAPTPENSSPERQYAVLARLLRGKCAAPWRAATDHTIACGKKQVFYFSMEFLIGTLLKDYLLNLNCLDVVREGLQELGIDLEDLCQAEKAAGLGNGGLGRLAACFLDSMAFLGMPGNGMGIRYRYGFFTQKIVDGFQAELPDTWLSNGYPWELRQPELAVTVNFKGHLEEEWRNGRLFVTCRDTEQVRAVPYDVPIVGAGPHGTINYLRLWSAEAVSDSLDMESFNKGDFSRAVRERAEAEAISYILYPEDSSYSGRELRLKQEYFLVSAGIQSILRQYLATGASLKVLARKIAIHINDTHPALAIPELMRIFLDEYGMDWDVAWQITWNTLSYTNHTILPEAMEKWDTGLLSHLLPRIYQIIVEIDRRYRLEHHIPAEAGDTTTIIHDNCVWMANLAVIGSHSVNGVAQLHTQILKESTMADLYRVFPERFNNKTNGISHRRFVIKANPGLTALLDETLGESWRLSPDRELPRLKKEQGDTALLQRLHQVKQENKLALAQWLWRHQGVRINPESVVDAQVKRIHAYKRQTLNLFRIMAAYEEIQQNPNAFTQPITFLIGGKAAPGYHYAKSVIRLAHALSEKIAADPLARKWLQLVFVEDYNTQAAEIICPATDISEQISTASQEASGTGNMKFMFNGALTLGTLDGSTVEICRRVGEKNIYIFGLRAEEVMAYYQHGGYSAYTLYAQNEQIHALTEHLVDGYFPNLGSHCQCIYEDLLQGNDHYFVLADFTAYEQTWKQMLLAYGDTLAWQKKALCNIAEAGYFTSDRTIREYADEIWHMDYQRD